MKCPFTTSLQQSLRHVASGLVRSEVSKRSTWRQDLSVKNTNHLMRPCVQHRRSVFSHNAHLSLFDATALLRPDTPNTKSHIHDSPSPSNRRELDWNPKPCRSFNVSLRILAAFPFSHALHFVRLHRLRSHLCRMPAVVSAFSIQSTDQHPVDSTPHQAVTTATHYPGKKEPGT